MKPRFRQSMNWLHTWGGFSFGWLVYFIFVTGTVGYFDSEIDRWMKPEITVVNESTNEYKVLETAERELNKLAPDSPQWYIGFPTSRGPFLGISWLQLANSETNTKREWHEKTLHPESGSIIDVRETAGGETLYRMHYNLHYVPQLVGYILTSLAAMLMLIGLITGVIIHKKIFIEFFTFRPKKGARSWLDIHNLLSVLPLPFHLMITYSGLLLLMGVTMSSVINVTYGEGKEAHGRFYKEAQLEVKERKFINLPPMDLSLKNAYNDAKTRYQNQSISYVGLIGRDTKDEHYEIWFDAYEGIHLASAIEYRIKDNQVEIEISKEKAGSAAQIYDLFEHLHEGLFANIYLRWLYFISGLLGAAMLVTGMILWINKRKNKTSKKSNITIVSVIDRINAGVTVGVPLAIAAYFWGNRLLPVALHHRAEWEVHCFFIAFLMCIVFCLCRASNKMWVNTLWVTAVAYILLPVINITTTEHSIVKSLQTNDWLMLGFDFSMLLFGGCFAMAAMLVNRNNQKKAAALAKVVNNSKQQTILQDIHS